MGHCRPGEATADSLFHCCYQKPCCCQHHLTGTLASRLCSSLLLQLLAASFPGLSVTKSSQQAGSHVLWFMTVRRTNHQPTATDGVCHPMQTSSYTGPDTVGGGSPKNTRGKVSRDSGNSTISMLLLRRLWLRKKFKVNGLYPLLRTDLSNTSKRIKMKTLKGNFGGSL